MSASTEHVWDNRYVNVNTSMRKGTIATQNCPQADVICEERMQGQSVPRASVLPFIPRANLLSKTDFLESSFSMYLLLAHTMSKAEGNIKQVKFCSHIMDFLVMSNGTVYKMWLRGLQTWGMERKRKLSAVAWV